MSHEPRFCSFCQEMVYSLHCPYCERPVKGTSLYGDTDSDNSSLLDSPEVDEGQGWGSGEVTEDGLSVISYDDIFGASDTEE